MVISEGEKLWDDFCEQVKSLFETGYGLPLSVHMLAIRKMEDELYAWKNKVHIDTRPVAPAPKSPRKKREKLQQVISHGILVSKVSTTLPVTTPISRVHHRALDTMLEAKSEALRRSSRQSRKPAKFRDYNEMTKKTKMDDSSNVTYKKASLGKIHFHADDDKNARDQKGSKLFDSEAGDPDCSILQKEQLPYESENCQGMSGEYDFSLLPMSEVENSETQKQNEEKSVIADHNFLTNLLARIKKETERKDSNKLHENKVTDDASDRKSDEQSEMLKITDRLLAAGEIPVSQWSNEREDTASSDEIITAPITEQPESPKVADLKQIIKMETVDSDFNDAEKNTKRHLEIKGDYDFVDKRRKTPVKLDEDFYNEDPTVSKMYKCDVCKEQFAYKFNLSLHVKKEHSNGPIACPECDRVYKNRTTLKQHLALHNGKAYQCPECNYRVGNRAWLDSHIRAIHRKDDPNSRPHLCSVCGAGFVKASTCRRHEQTHNVCREKPFACDQCSHKTYTRFLLNAHIRNTHTTTDPYVCNICGAKCKYKQSLAEHQLRHIGARPYACPHCNATFVTKSTLAVHLKIHETPQHKCHVCQKMFTQRGQLQRHLVVHTGAKDFTCTHCKYRCNLPDNLRKHMKSVHKLQLEVSETHKRVQPIQEIPVERRTTFEEIIDGTSTFEEVQMSTDEVTYVAEGNYERESHFEQQQMRDNNQVVFEYIHADPNSEEVKIEGDVANAVLALAGQNTEEGVIQEIIVQQIEGEDGEYIQQYFTVYADGVVEGAVQEVEG